MRLKNLHKVHFLQENGYLLIAFLYFCHLINLGLSWAIFFFSFFCCHVFIFFYYHFSFLYWPLYFTPYCLSDIVLSSFRGSPYILHISSYFLLFFFPLDPLLQETIMFFRSCSPPTMKWTPSRRYEGHDLQGPSTNTKMEKKTKKKKKKIGDQFSSSIVAVSEGYIF